MRPVYRRRRGAPLAALNRRQPWLRPAELVIGNRPRPPRG